MSSAVRSDTIHRYVARFSNPGRQAIMWWAKSAPPVIIGLTELNNSYPAHPLAASLLFNFELLAKDST